MTLKLVKYGDLPENSVEKKPSANAGDTGLIPGPGTFHTPWSN